MATGVKCTWLHMFLYFCKFWLSYRQDALKWCWSWLFQIARRVFGWVYLGCLHFPSGQRRHRSGFLWQIAPMSQLIRVTRAAKQLQIVIFAFHGGPFHAEAAPTGIFHWYLPVIEHGKREKPLQVGIKRRTLYINGGFSIAMFDYQRVSAVSSHLGLAVKRHWKMMEAQCHRCQSDDFLICFASCWNCCRSAHDCAVWSIRIREEKSWDAIILLGWSHSIKFRTECSKQQRQKVSKHPRVACNDVTSSSHSWWNWKLILSQNAAHSVTSYLWHWITKLYSRILQASAWPWLLFLRWSVGKVPAVTNSSHGRDAPRQRLEPLRLAMPWSFWPRRALGVWFASPGSDGPRAASRPQQRQLLQKGRWRLRTRWLKGVTEPGKDTLSRGPRARPQEIMMQRCKRLKQRDNVWRKWTPKVWTMRRSWWTSVSFMLKLVATPLPWNPTSWPRSSLSTWRDWNRRMEPGC